MRFLFLLLLTTTLALGQESVALIWLKNPRATGYVVKFGENGNLTNSLNTAKNSITISNLKINALYSFRVSAYIVRGWEGPPSDELKLRIRK